MKKILILGATAGEISLVKRAQELGYYVVVTDNHTDWTLSPAKLYADEAWNVSWSDIDMLESMCLQHGVNGVTAGYSEFRVENMIKLCSRLGFPCYLTMEQLDITRDKVKFKETCRQYGVPVVKEYKTIEDVDEYPVIVKPVDRAGSIGISIATNEQELRKAYSYALEMSVTKQVIIEQYVQADKVDFYYAIENGNIELISSCDTIQAVANGYDRVVQSSWLYPERHLSDALEKIDSKIRKMINGMNLQYGCIFYSGFVDDHRDFVFFECGYRLEGGHQYTYVSKLTGINYLDIFILHAMEGNTNHLQRLSKRENLKCVTINLYAKKGIIKEIKGFDKVAELETCSLALVHARIGQKCDDSKAILDKIGMFSICSEFVDQIKRDVKLAYSFISVTDSRGADMIYDRIDESQIETWWE